MIRFNTKRICALLMTGWLAAGVTAQNFQKVYPTTYDKTSRDIVYTGDGYMIAGMTNNTDITDCDLYIMKTDLNGEMLWQKVYGGAKPDYPYSMCKTHDGNYFILGFSQSFGPGDFDVYLIKVDGNGDKIWEKTFAGWGNEEGREIIKTADNHYVIAGTSNSSNWTSSQNAFLMKIDVDGNLVWRKFYGGSNKEYGNGVKQLADGGYLLVGQTYSFGQGGNTYIVKTDAAGDTVWTKHFGGPLAEEAVSVVVEGDGSSVFAVRDSTSSKDIDVRMMKLDASGNVVIDKIFGGNMKDTPKTINKTSDGGYIVGAISRSFGWINPDMWLMKFNSSLDTMWTRHYGHSDHEHCHMAKEHIDGDLLAIGHARSWGPGQKIYFLKLNSNGAVSVKENSPIVAGGIRIYPNPADGGVISVISSQGGSCRISVSDVSGRCVFSEERNAVHQEEEWQIDLKEKRPGLYFLSVDHGNGIVASKFIIN